MRFAVEDAKRVQRDLKLGGLHVAYVDGGGFVLAHTDYERACQDVVSLWKCPVHAWLDSPFFRLPLCVPEPGWYSVDADLEPGARTHVMPNGQVVQVRGLAL